MQLCICTMYTFFYIHMAYMYTLSKHVSAIIMYERIIILFNYSSDKERDPNRTYQTIGATFFVIFSLPLNPSLSLALQNEVKLKDLVSEPTCISSFTTCRYDFRLSFICEKKITNIIILCYSPPPPPHLHLRHRHHEYYY